MLRMPSVDPPAPKMNNLTLQASPVHVSEVSIPSTEFAEDAQPSPSTTDTIRSVTASRDTISTQESVFPPPLLPDLPQLFLTLLEPVKTSTPSISEVNVSASPAST